MAQVPEDNLKLIGRFTELATTIAIRQKAAEIALRKLGMSEVDWRDARAEAVASMSETISSSEESTEPIENFLERLSLLLTKP